MTEPTTSAADPEIRRPDGLVDRERDLAVLEAASARARTGDGALMVLEGPAGIGKSALLATLRDQLDASVTTLRARAGDLEQDFPFGVVRQLFEGLLADPAVRERRLDGAAATAAPVFPRPRGGGD
ncbi:AAA family ATPase [Conexibacter sp. W3-3-2]|uniref:AAA family ATPase n=1 Tax=Conexibacter sp. W3-3-2 TaxID=2675227 RepID=UPI0018AA0FE9|nr:AAA family ATPase [Conexibacter sp. W3-3-2]